jgi:hypothetical protein
MYSATVMPAEMMQLSDGVSERAEKEVACRKIN